MAAATAWEFLPAHGKNRRSVTTYNLKWDFKGLVYTAIVENRRDQAGPVLISSEKRQCEVGVFKGPGKYIEMFLEWRGFQGKTDVYVAVTYPATAAFNKKNGYEISESSCVYNPPSPIRVPLHDLHSRKDCTYTQLLTPISSAQAPIQQSNSNTKVLWAKTTYESDKYIHTWTSLHFDIIILKTTGAENDNELDSLSAGVVSPTRASLDTKNLLFSPTCSDLTIYSEDKEFPAHKIILSNGSSVFLQMFLQPMAENLTGKLKIEDSEPEVVEEFLRFMYTGALQNLAKNASGLFLIADKYDVQDLKTAAENSLIATITNENIFDRYALAKLMNSPKLMDKCVEKIKKDKKAILKTEDELQEICQKFPELVFKALI